jgi:uncharacterized protein (TIGR02284 family)
VIELINKINNMENQDEIRSKVNHLLEVCNERKTGYQKAAENVKDPSLSSLFNDFARQSQDFANELVQFSNINDPEEVGTRTVSDLFRAWMDLKSALMNKDSDAMISACVRGEERTIDNYEDCLKDELPLELKEKIEKQLAQIKVAYREIKSKEV